MRVRTMRAAMALAGVLVAATHASAEDDTSIKLIGLAASMNEMAVACGDMSASDVAAAQSKQRQAMLDQGMSAKAYEQAYAEAKTSFLKKWKSGSPQQQQSSCAQIKAQSEQSKAALRKLEK